MRATAIESFLGLRAPPSDTHKIEQYLRETRMVTPMSSGQYAFTPLFVRCLRKVEGLMDLAFAAAGVQEMQLPILQPQVLWEKSQRFGVFKSSLYTLTDRRGRALLLSPTCEEQISAWLGTVKPFSKNAFPLAVYQKNHKFRDEVGGGSITRTREFIMYDAYFWALDAAVVEEAGLRAMGNLSQVLSLLGVPHYRALARESSASEYAGHRSVNLFIPTEIGTGNFIHVCRACQQAISPESRCPNCGSAEAPTRIQVMEVARFSPLGARFPENFDLRFQGRTLEMGCLGAGPVRMIVGVLGQVFENADIIWPEVIAPVLIVTLRSDFRAMAGKEGFLDDVYSALCRRTSQSCSPTFLRESVVHDDRDIPYSRRFAEWVRRGAPYIVDCGGGSPERPMRVWDRARGTVRVFSVNETVGFLFERIRHLEEEVTGLCQGFSSSSKAPQASAGIS